MSAGGEGGFSSSLRVAQDFLIPSAVCINPPQPKEAEVLQHSSDGPEVMAMKHLVPLKITLQDCLACNGCVTSAEAVLVEAQSVDELKKAFAASNSDYLWYISISEQSAVSLASHWGMSVTDAYEVIAGFLKHRMQTEVDLGGCSEDSWAQRIVVTDLCWAEEYAAYKVSVEYDQRKATQRLPLVTSSCPGLCCYWEKQGGDLLGLLSNVMSPQGIAGSYVKRRMALQDPSKTVYHLTIQPCFDRKLEAARDGYMASVPHTDCVLSTVELLQWMNDCHVSPIAIPGDPDWKEPKRAMLDSHTYKIRSLTSRSTEQARYAGSGGYHQRLLFHLEHPTVSGSCETSVSAWADDGGIVYSQQRNLNHQVVRLASDTSLSGTFHVAYGFQHIQNIVRQLRTMQKKAANPGQLSGKEAIQQRLALLQKKRLKTAESNSVNWAECQFLELMACPHGCLNGGGQVRVAAEASHLDSLFSKAAESVAASPPVSECKDLRWSFDGLCSAENEAWANSSENPSAELRGDLLWYCEFKDRRAEFEKVLNEGGVHVLQW